VSVTAAQGFVAAGIPCGVKESGDRDLSLVATASGEAVTAAAVFTANKMTAAPVVTSRAHLDATGGRAAAVVLNSGNANAATGTPGRIHAEQMCQAVAAELGCAAEEVLVCSTGLIGIPLPIEAILGGTPALAAARRADGGEDAAEAIRTTDTHRKEATATRGGVTVGGMAKGAAMLAPNMATMLAVLTTDAEVDGPTLARSLQAAVGDSFNRLVVDGCTSTNDTVIVLANGEAGPPATPEDLLMAIADVCRSLSMQMAGDAEGATKVVRVEVQSAATADDADRGARAVANSQRTKCSWYGCDPYWGRVASDLGSAGIEFDPDRIAVAYGGVTVASGGVTVPHDEEAVAKHMAGRELEITADLGLGGGHAHVITNDLTHAYVDENMGTS
jgi:glutamate N-acetyltransferase/amino-acid N-acetyltransferase